MVVPMITSTSDLLDQIEAFCAERGVSATRFGLLTTNDGKLVPRLRAGKTVTLETAAKIKAFMDRSPAEEPAA